MKKYLIIPLIILIFLTSLISARVVFADELSDNINEQLNNLDLSELENFIDQLNNNQSSFLESLKLMLNGEYDNGQANIYSYVLSIIFNSINDFTPILLSVVAISLFCVFIQNSKSSFASEGVSEIIYLIGFLTILLLMSSPIYSIYNNTKNNIENIAKLNEIMSPIIITLMIASGGSVSASVYKPVVTTFSNIVINLMLYVVMPILGLCVILCILSNFSKHFNFNKFTDVFFSVVKWALGISVTIYSLFMSIQGVSSAMHDGISIKATKYAISNSIPIIGGFLKDGFDLFLAGSVLIKNAIGVVSLFSLLSFMISPILNVAVFCLILKIISAITQVISDNKISSFCTSLSKAITYINVVQILISVMFFITILLMIFSANAFI